MDGLCCFPLPLPGTGSFCRSSDLFFFLVIDLSAFSGRLVDSLLGVTSNRGISLGDDRHDDFTLFFAPLEHCFERFMRAFDLLKDLVLLRYVLAQSLLLLVLHGFNVHSSKLKLSWELTLEPLLFSDELIHDFVVTRDFLLLDVHADFAFPHFFQQRQQILLERL